mgnify:CR=1 FL=1
MSDGAVDRRFGLGDVDHLGHAVDPVTHDPLDAALERLRRDRTGAAGADQPDGHDARGLVDIDELDVTVVGLEGRPDHFDAGFDFASHDKHYSITVWAQTLRRSLGRVRLAAILAHEGGWDEILLVGGPILVIVGLLTVVKRRVDSQMPPDAGELQPDDEPIGDAGSDTGG